jgi:CRISPR-associated protein Cas5t
VRLAVWIQPGSKETAPRPLAERVRAVVDREEISNRFGALALGESTHLVDELRRLRDGDGLSGRLLLGDSDGNLALPIWVDHVGSQGTRWGQYRLQETDLTDLLPPAAWISILPPETSTR